MNQKIFPRISRLPPYVFSVIGELKATARSAGEDIVDMSMGNPDQPPPRHIGIRHQKGLRDSGAQFVIGIDKNTM